MASVCTKKFYSELFSALMFLFFYTYFQSKGKKKTFKGQEIPLTIEKLNVFPVSLIEAYKEYVCGNWQHCDKCARDLLRREREATKLCGFFLNCFLKIKK